LYIVQLTYIENCCNHYRGSNIFHLTDIIDIGSEIVEAYKDGSTDWDSVDVQVYEIRPKDEPFPVRYRTDLTIELRDELLKLIKKDEEN